MAGGLGGLGGFDFGGILGAIGQSLLTSPRDAPFSGFPAAMQARAKNQEHQAELSAMSLVAEKMGIPKELAASPTAMKMFMEHLNAEKLNKLRIQAAQGISLMPPDDDGAQPGMSVPGAPGASQGGLGGLGGYQGRRGALGAAASGTNPVASTFLNTVKAGGLTNPYGLAAVAATGKHESGWNPSKALQTWSDPSESGQAGTSGGLMAWRADRLANMQNFMQRAGGDPITAQAKFFLQENPGLIQQLNQAKSPEEAAGLMANAWKFAGYDRPGGEAANRLATTRAMLGRIGGGDQAGAQPTGAVAKLPGMGADSRTVEIVSAAQKYLPEGYTIRQTSGHRPGDSGFHGAKGANAIDVQIIDPQGRPVDNRGEDPTGLYTRLARGAYGEMLSRYPDLNGRFAWGGSFGTEKSGQGPRDLMHFDLGGETRGRYTQYHLRNLGPLGGGAAPAQGMAMGRPIQLASADPNMMPGSAGAGLLAGGVGIAPPGAVEESRRREAAGLDINTPPSPINRRLIEETLALEGQRPMGLYRPAGGRIASADPNVVPGAAPAMTGGRLTPASTAALADYARTLNDPNAAGAGRQVLPGVGTGGEAAALIHQGLSRGLTPEAAVAAAQQQLSQQSQGAAPALPTPQPILRPGEKGYKGPVGPVPLPPPRPNDLPGGLPRPQVPLPPPRPDDLMPAPNPVIPQPILRPGERGYRGPTGPVPYPPARPSDIGLPRVAPADVPLPPPRPSDVGLPRAAVPVPPGLSPTGAPTVLNPRLAGTQWRLDQKPGVFQEGPAGGLDARLRQPQGPQPQGAAPGQAGGTLDASSAAAQAALIDYVRDPNDPVAAQAMQRILANASGPVREQIQRGIDFGRQFGQGAGAPAQGAAESSPAAVGQSGARLDQVASGGSRTPRVPLPDATIPTTPAAPPAGTAPATPDAGSATPPAAKGTNKTKAWAAQQFQIGMNILAASGGDPVLMKQAEIIMNRAAKYGDPSDTAKRVGEAGLTGTPVGRALIAGFPNHVVEQLLEQQIPGYESPGTLEKKKFKSAEEERAWQHQRLEREFGASEYEKSFRRNLDTSKYGSEERDKAFRRGLDERRFGQTVTQQDRQFQQGELDRAQRAADAAESRRIQQMPPEQKLGQALTSDTSGAQTRAGLEEKQRQIAAEARARDVAAAQTKHSAEVTGAAQAAEALISPVKQAREALNKVVEMGAYGPMAPGMRTLNAIIPDIPGMKPAHAAEVQKQRFDQAISSIGAAKAALINKAQGGGNMSGTEQVLARADLAKLNSADPSIAQEALQKLDDEIAVALARDKAGGLYGGAQQQTPANQRQQPANQPAAAPAQGGWIDMGNGVRVRRK